MLIALLALLAPEAAFAQSGADPGPEWSIRIEYRYTKGEEANLNIPDSFSRYGRNYYLIDKSDPVLEKKLPAKRTYTWFVDGILTEEGLSLLDGMENIELIEITIEIGREADRVETMTGRPTNDVEAIPLKKTYPDGVYTRAGVQFEVEDEDDLGLPIAYTAKIVYRGIETYIGPGYQVSATYTTVKNLEGVPQYVVVATYAPDGLAAINTGGGTSGGGGGAGAGGTDTPPAVPPDDTSPVVPPIDAEPDPGAGAGIEIQKGETPLGSGTGAGAGAVNPRTIVLLIIIVGAALVLAWILLTKRKESEEKKGLREERRREALHAQGLVEYDG